MLCRVVLHYAVVLGFSTASFYTIYPHPLRSLPLSVGHIKECIYSIVYHTSDIVGVNYDIINTDL